MDPNELLSRILAAQSGGVSGQAMGAAGAGVGRTDFSALLNPQLLAGLGAFDPYQAAAGFDPYYEGRVRNVAQDFQSSQANIRAGVVRPPELDIDEVIPKYANPRYANVAEPIQSLFSLILDGYDASSAKVALDNLYGEYPELEQYDEQLRTDLDRYQKERETVAAAARRYNRDLIEAEQRLGALAQPTMPDYDAARRDYYSDLGVPGMAVLPDPRQQYQFADPELRALLQQEEETQYERAQRGLQENMQRRAQIQPSSFEVQPRRRVPGSRFDDSLDPANMIEGFGERDIDALSAANQVAAQQRQVVASRLQENLLAQGRTPFEDSMRSLLQFAVTEAAPRPRASSGAAPRLLNPRITI